MKTATKKPVHLAFVLGEGRGVSRFPTTIVKRNADDILKNIIQTARRFGVQYMTLYCLDDVASDCSHAMSHELRVLFYLLLIEADWLEKREVNIRSSIERREPAKAGDARLQLSVVSHLNSGPAQSNVVTLQLGRTVRGGAAGDELSARMIEDNINQRDFPDLDLMIFSGGLQRRKSNEAMHSAACKTMFIDQNWEDLAPSQFEKILEEHVAGENEISRMAGKKDPRVMVG